LKAEVELKTIYFEHPGIETTETTLQIAKHRAEELGIKKIIVASTTGDTAVRAMGILKGLEVIVVTHVTGMREPNVQEFTEKNRQIVISQGGIIVTAAHAFSGLSAAMRQRFSTSVMGDIVAQTLRIFGQGLKVACEIALMAADSGQVHTGEDIISVGGTGHGADTALLLTPVISRNFFDLKVKEILCKPHH
jgi:hypothetical protein